jgi:hypothetical protein
MIAKRVPRRRDGKSSFGQLVTYLKDDQGKESRVGDITVTNCQSDDPAWAVIEIEATQDINRRAKSDKTYHLVYSFREGEDISPDVLRALEDELCKGLGYESHQRISVVHRDTDNLHVHVAINKIHPQTHNLIEPYYDHKKLGEICTRLEATYGLERDNHAPSKAPNKADDLAAKSGMETFADWLKQTSYPGCAIASTWSELHAHLSHQGVSLQKRGAGLVFVNDDGLAVKASSVSRDLSLKALEGRLGTFQPSNDLPKARVSSRYTPRPKVSSELLFTRYQSERTSATIRQRDGLAFLQKEKLSALEAAKRAAKTKRAATKALKGFGANVISRRLLYSQIARSHKAEIAKIQKEFADKRTKLYAAAPKKAFRDWVAAQATLGDSEALAYMRAQGSRMKGNRLGSSTAKPSASSLPVMQVDSVTRSGAVTYATPAGNIRDDGNRFQLDRDPSETAISTALQMAVKRHGSKLSIEGSDSFKSKVASVAGRLSLDVTFNNQHLENIRKASVSGGHEHKSGVQKYIDERNNKRAGGFDIMKHRRFEAKDAGVRVFAGLRKVDGDAVALFSSGEEILALPINAATASRLQRQRLGQDVEVKADGSCQVKRSPRSR